MTDKWIYESFQSERFLPYTPYLLPCFSGLHIGVVGFSEQHSAELRGLIEQNDGAYYMKVNEIAAQKVCHVLVVKQSQLKQYESLIDTLEIPAVGVDWLKACIIHSRKLRTSRFLLKEKAEDDGARRQEIALHQSHEGHCAKVLDDFEASDKIMKYLHRCVVYFHNVNDKVEKLQRKLVAAGGGFYVKDFLPTVTHVVTESCSEGSFAEMTKYRDVNIVGIMWLVDCLRYRRRINEDEYFVRPCPNSTAHEDRFKVARMTFDSRSGANTMHGLHRRNSFATTSLQLSTLQRSNATGSGFGEASKLMASSDIYQKKADALPKLSMSKTVSGPSAFPSFDSGSKGKQKLKSQSKGKPRKQQPEVTSYILKGCVFYLDPNLGSKWDHYWRLVLTHGARVIQNINDFEEIHWVLADSSDSLEKMAKNKHKPKLSLVSWRWIEASLQKKRAIDQIKEELQYMPFPHKMPLESFKNKCIYPAGFEPKNKHIIKEVLQTFGAKVSYHPYYCSLFSSSYSSLIGRSLMYL